MTTDRIVNEPLWTGWITGRQETMSHAAVVERFTTPRTLEEWHEDFGPVLWWSIPVNEPPYVGTPLDDDWPGHHTHWTPILEPQQREVRVLEQGQHWVGKDGVVRRIDKMAQGVVGYTTHLGTNGWANTTEFLDRHAVTLWVEPKREWPDFDTPSPGAPFGGSRG